MNNDWRCFSYGGNEKMGHKDLKVVIAAGSSGGHIFPAFATALKLREINAANEIVFIGTKKELDIEILKNGGYAFYTLSPDKNFFKDIVNSFLILRKVKPAIAVGFGGYVSFPVLIAAKMIGVPTVIHEQNLVPGLSNRYLSKLVDRICISFNETRAGFMKKSRIAKTGNPIRGSLVKLKKENVLELFGLDKERFTILVMGGSQGAHFINDVVLDVIKAIPLPQRGYLQFMHLSGLKDFEFVKSKYELLGVNSRVFSFCDRMSEVYSAADLVISRAGATSIAEITFFGLPSILIPYPNPRVHQVENAKFLKDKDAAVVVEQDSLSSGYLKEIVMNLVRDRYRLKQMSENISGLSAPDAAHRLAMEIIDAAKK